MPTSKTLAVFDAAAGRPPSANFPQLDLRNDTIVLDFDDTVDESVDFLSVLPQAYAGSNIEVVITWTTTTATSGSVVWQASFERHSIDDASHGTHDLDTDDFETARNLAMAAPSSSGELAQTTIGLSTTDADDPLSGDSYRLRVKRLATDGSDTVSDDAELISVELREV